LDSASTWWRWSAWGARPTASGTASGGSIIHANWNTRAGTVFYLAARFCSEALFKALGTGWGQRIRWVDVEVQNMDSGQPILILHRRGGQEGR
jgi:hypothetical protein